VHLKSFAATFLPNTFPYVIVAATLSVPYYILGDSRFKFFSCRHPGTEREWGSCSTRANTEYMRNYPGCSRRRGDFCHPFWLSTFSAMD